MIRRSRTWNSLLLGLFLQMGVAAAEEHQPSVDAQSNSEIHTAPATENAEPLISPPVTPAVIGDIRLLFSLQDRAADGNRETVQLQKALLSQIGRELTEDIQKLQPNAIAESVAGFVLSGGSPAIAERLMMREGLSNRNRKLLEGSALFMRGKRKDSLQTLQGLDVLQLRPSVSGRLALAEAIATTDDSELQQSLFAIAIATMPGTLVEESSLRRSALAYAQADNQNQFWRRTFRYQRRFSKSIYAADFPQVSLESAVRFEKSGREMDRAKTDLFQGVMPAAKRRSLYLHLARLAVQLNHQKLLTFAAARLQRLAVPGGQEAQIAELYMSIFNVAAGDPSQAADRLTKLSPTLLPDLERSLLEAALTVVGEVQRPLQTRDIVLASADVPELIGLRTLVDTALRAADNVVEGSRQ